MRLNPVTLIQLFLIIVRCPSLPVLKCYWLTVWVFAFPYITSTFISIFYALRNCFFACGMILVLATFLCPSNIETANRLQSVSFKHFHGFKPFKVFSAVFFKGDLSLLKKGN